MLIFVSITLGYFYFFCFPNIIIYILNILNIASAIKKMTVNEIGSLKTIIKEYGLLKKTVTIQ